MLNEKHQTKEIAALEGEEFRLSELEPIELILDRMMDAEPEPEMIEGLPPSDALTPADRYMETVHQRPVLIAFCRQQNVS